MGRMKDTLNEGPATISKAQAFGAIAVLVKCRPPCKRESSVRFDALGLPRDTQIDQIATLKRFVCKDCGRRATSVSVDWDAKAEGRVATWGGLPPD